MVSESRPGPATGPSRAWTLEVTGFGTSQGPTAGQPTPSEPEITVYVVCAR